MPFDDMSQAGVEAVDDLEKSGFSVGPEREGMLVAIRRRDGNANAWLDVGDTVRVVGDGTADPGNTVYEAAVAALSRPART